MYSTPPTGNSHSLLLKHNIVTLLIYWQVEELVKAEQENRRLKGELERSKSKLTTLQEQVIVCSSGANCSAV